MKAQIFIKIGLKIACGAIHSIRTTSMEAAFNELKAQGWRPTPEKMVNLTSILFSELRKPFINPFQK